MDLLPTAVETPTREEFPHVSFTPEGRRSDPDRMLDAAERWKPIASRTVARFDVDAFQNTYGLKDSAATWRASPDTIIDVLNDPRFRKGAAADLRDPSGTAAERIGRALRAGSPIRSSSLLSQDARTTPPLIAVWHPTSASSTPCSVSRTSRMR
jgi:predicted TIM-barrel fold metal-dependent hydrolase